MTVYVEHAIGELDAEARVALVFPCGAAFGAQRFVIAAEAEARSDADAVLAEKLCGHPKPGAPKVRCVDATDGLSSRHQFIHVRCQFDLTAFGDPP